MANGWVAPRSLGPPLTPTRTLVGSKNTVPGPELTNPFLTNLPAPLFDQTPPPPRAMGCFSKLAHGEPKCLSKRQADRANRHGALRGVRICGLRPRARAGASGRTGGCRKGITQEVVDSSRATQELLCGGGGTSKHAVAEQVATPELPPPELTPALAFRRRFRRPPCETCSTPILGGQMSGSHPQAAHLNANPFLQGVSSSCVSPSVCVDTHTHPSVAALLPERPGCLGTPRSSSIASRYAGCAASRQSCVPDICCS